MKKRFLAQSYQHFINKYCGGNKNIVLDQMKEYAECFRNNLKPKKAGKGQNKPGLLLCASGLYTLHDVLQKNDWNEHEIENRAEWLLANAQNIWKI